jgi:hypothetical protein
MGYCPRYHHGDDHPTPKRLMQMHRLSRSQTIRVAKAKSGRPKSRFIKRPRLYAATFAATRVSKPQTVWAPGYLSPQLSRKFAKVVSTTWRTALHRRCLAGVAPLGKGVLEAINLKKQLSIVVGFCYKCYFIHADGSGSTGLHAGW